MKSAPLLALTLALLSACGHEPSDPPVTVLTDTTPAVQGYDAEFQDQLLDELLFCTRCAAMKITINDYLTMRDEARVITTQQGR